MTAYWCRFIDSRGRIFASEKLVASSDAEAVAKVRAILSDDPNALFELWDGSRRIDIEQVERSERTR
jgi:hypothetical protein